MNLLARSLAVFFVGVCSLSAWAGSAAPASYSSGARSESYSFADLFRRTVEAENVLAAIELPPGPRVADGGPAVPVGTGAPRTEPSEAAAPIPARALGPAAAQTPLVSLAGMPQPARWLMVISGLAIALFIARRRSNSAV